MRSLVWVGFISDQPNAWRAVLALDGRGRPSLHGLCRVRGSIDQPAGDLGVAVDAAVAQEGPVAADVFQGVQVDFAYQNFFLVLRGFGDDFAEGVAEERASPKFQAVPGSGIAAHVTVFVSDAIYHRHVD